MKQHAIVILGVFLFAAAVSVSAEDIRIVAPYAGTLTDSQDVDNYGKSDDSGLLTGLYFQWIRPDSYQWNAFLYYAPDVNYSRVLGGHFIYDYYLAPDWNGKFVLGMGIETLRVDLDAGDSFGTDSFEMGTTMLIPYLRAGKYFKASRGPVALSLLPWAGIEPQWTWGDMKMKMTIPMMGEMTVKDSLDDYALYGIAGLNFKATLFRFIDLETKYQGTFDSDDWFSTWNLVANLFFTRNWGLSYRFKSMETSQGSDLYHYFGIAYSF